MFTNGGKGTVADAVENRSGVIDRWRLLPMRRLPFFALGNKCAAETMFRAARR
jgi:hypothetical protein